MLLAHLYLCREAADGFDQVQLQKAGEAFPANFMRHYYDIYCLLTLPEVQEFIGTPAYEARKVQRFRSGDELLAAKNPAFLLEDPEERVRFASEYRKTSALYYNGQPDLDEILCPHPAVHRQDVAQRRFATRSSKMSGHAFIAECPLKFTSYSPFSGNKTDSSAAIIGLNSVLVKAYARRCSGTRKRWSYCSISERLSAMPATCNSHGISRSMPTLARIALRIW